MSSLDDLDIEQIIAAAKPAEVSVRLCLRGDLNAEHDRLTRALAEARTDGRSDTSDEASERSVADADPAVELAQQVLDVEQRMREASVEFLLRAVTRDDYVVLQAAATTDGAVDVDRFVASLIPRSVIKPNGTPEQLQRLVDVLSAGQYERLAQAAFRVNTGAVDVPFSRLASVVGRSWSAS